MNHQIITGRLTRDPELKALPSGDTVCNMRLAFDQRNAKDETGYIDIASFGAGGEAAARYLSKGSPVIFDGRIAYRSWTADDGSNRSALSGVGNVEFMPRDKSGDSSAETEPAEAA
jgi:single-strand DNA-binding protein